MSLLKKCILMIGFASLSMATGCAKNVDRIEFQKWGNSFIPRGTNMDTTAQGGAMQANGQVPQNDNNKIPKASVGGSYSRSFSRSTNYQMVGGFHVNAGR